VTDLRALMDVAVGVAREAGDASLHGWRSGPVESRNKSRLDIVTDVDVRTERLIISALRRTFPDHEILGEESGAVGVSGSDWEWVIDPIDGTVNFAAGLPEYSVSLGLRQRKLRVLGVVYAPALGEIYSAARGHGARCGACPIEPSRTRELRDAVVAVMLAPHFEDHLIQRTVELISRLAAVCRGVRIQVSQALELAWVASGRLDATVSLWRSAEGISAAAGEVLVEEAGGRLSGANGRGLGDPGAYGFVASTPGIYHSLLEAMSTGDAEP